MAAPTTDLLADARTELEARIRRGRLRSADDLREDFPAAWADPESKLELVFAEYVYRVANGEQPSRDDWFSRYPEFHRRLGRLFGLHDLMAGGDTHRPAATVGNAPPVPTVPADGDHPDGYEVLGEIGRGGMAVVYQARQIELNRMVALKVLRWGGWEGPDDARRVRREAELVARLQHPNIVQVIEVGEWDGSPFLALEYVPGGTLADAIASTHRQGKTGISTAEAVALVELLARATQYAHEQGVVHRDLKPANVLLADDPAGPFARPKVTDFGLAVSTELSAAVSQSAMLAGTPCYMTPEQATARRDAVGPRTDVYALGGILYELLTGRPPFQGATVLETLDLVRHAEPVPPRLLRPAVPRDLETVCLKCLAKDPARRYPTADALGDDLTRFRDGRPITARPVGAVERAWKWCRRQPLVAGMLCGLLVAVLVAMVLPSVFWKRAEDGRVREEGLRQAAEAGLERETGLREALVERQTRLLMTTALLQWKNHNLTTARETLYECREQDRGAEWARLLRACRPPVATMSPMSNFSPKKLVFSPDGRRLACSFGMSEVMVWDADTGRHLHTAERGKNTFHDLAFPDAGRLVYAQVFDGPSLGQDVYVLNVYEVDPAVGVSKAIRSTPRRIPRNVPVNEVRLTGDGRFAVWYARKNQLEVLDVTDGTVRSLAATDVGFNSFRLSSGGNHIVTYPQSNKTRVFDPATLAEVRTFDLPEKVNADHYRVFGAISPDLNRLVLTKSISGQSSELTFRDLDRPTPDRHYFNPNDTTMSVVISPNGRLVACYAYRDVHVGVYDFVTGKRLLELRGEAFSVNSLAFSPDSTRLAVATVAPSVTIWDVTSDEP
jgi:hypothetical protein